MNKKIYNLKNKTLGDISLDPTIFDTVYKFEVEAYTSPGFPVNPVNVTTPEPSALTFENFL